MSTVTARIERTPYETHISGETQVIVADEPFDVGGLDRGMRPTELLCSALASCIVITLRMYADRKGWPLESAVAHVGYARDVESNRSLFTTQLILNGDLSEDQRLRLREIADRCPIHKALKNPIDFDTVLIEP
ncbi:OsmC family peroxiredoxin [Fibrisoma montanum]|uniref:OsmC family peroxiredoxin n=1 Tax=Fibrisoma montanum TaxID=2305895 RepID=A0A418MDJ9_9BACT|nr:OsmC family protein [Fibrisoma montanum]RIV24845.1 OsmC family peroxiredoxin [Fibrisoma montanum]